MQSHKLFFDLTNCFLQGLKCDLLSQLRLQKDKNTEGSNKDFTKTMMSACCECAWLCTFLLLRNSELLTDENVPGKLYFYTATVIITVFNFTTPLYVCILGNSNKMKVCVMCVSFCAFQWSWHVSVLGNLRLTLSGRLLDMMSTWREIVSTKLFLLVRRSSSARWQRQCNQRLTTFKSWYIVQ